MVPDGELEHSSRLAERAGALIKPREVDRVDEPSTLIGSEGVRGGGPSRPARARSSRSHIASSQKIGRSCHPLSVPGAPLNGPATWLVIQPP